MAKLFAFPKEQAKCFTYRTQSRMNTNQCWDDTYKIAKISLRLGSAFSGALLFCLREKPGNNGFWGCSAMDCLVHVEPKGTSLLDSSEWRNLSFPCETPYFSQWFMKTPTCRDLYYCNSDHYFWRVEAAFRVLLTVEYVVHEGQWVHQ